MPAKKSKKVNIDKRDRERAIQGQPKRHTVKAAKKKKASWEFPMTKKNFIYAAIGLGVIILGYALMATGITEDAATVDGVWNNPMAITVAPVLLVLGYCVIIPLAIMKLFKREED